MGTVYRALDRAGGQRPKLTPRQAQLAQQLYDAGGHTVQHTIYRHLQREQASA